MTDVILIWHYDQPNSERLRHVYRWYHRREAQTMADEENTAGCPYGAHPASCRGSYVEEVDYGPYGWAGFLADPTS